MNPHYIQDLFNLYEAILTQILQLAIVLALREKKFLNEFD